MVGNIVIVRFPYTDMRNAKLRPGLLVADVGYANQLDWMVCQVTTQLLPNSRQIALSPPDLEAGRLNERSWVRPDRMMTMNERIFEKTVARLTEAKTAEVLAAIRSFFYPGVRLSVRRGAARNFRQS